MASPVHRFLFSPPSSPTREAGSTTPLNTLKDFLVPGARSPAGYQDSYFTFTPSPKNSSPAAANSTVEFGPGGFHSTRGYPSRLAKPRLSLPSTNANVGLDRAQEKNSYLENVTGTDCSSSACPPPARSLVSKHKLHRRHTSSFSLPTISEHASAETFSRKWSLPSVSKPTAKIVVALTMCLVSTYLIIASLHWRSTDIVYREGTMSASMIRDQLLANDAGKVVTNTRVRPHAYVGGKKVTVGSAKGAPRVIATSSKGNSAIAPPKAYRPIKSASVLTPEREILALQTYLVENDKHTIAPSVDTSVPLDPVTILGFDARQEAGWAELRQEIDPIVVWDVGQTWTSGIYDLLDLYAVLPAPRVIPLAHREDAPAIQAILTRLIAERSKNTSPQPLITIGGVPVNGYAELVRLHKEGLLYGMLERAGAIVDGQKEAEALAAAKRSRSRSVKLAHIEKDSMPRI